MALEISLLVEETNKLRLSIGLPPLPLENELPAQERSTRPIVEINEQKLELAESSLKRRLEESRSAQDRKKLSKVKLIYEDPINTDDWLSRLGKGEKKVKRLVSSNVSPELGIKIGHNLNQLSALKDNSILTLEDSSVLQNDDELQNSDLKASEKLKVDLIEKKKADMIRLNGRTYRNLDEEPEAGEETSETVTTGEIQLPKVEEAKEEEKIDYKHIFNDDEFIQTKSDYSKPKKIKKIKKKEKKNERRRDDDDEVPVLDDEKIVPAKSTFQVIDDNLKEEEDELSTLLSMKRRIKQKEQRKNLTEEELAAEITLFKRWDLTNDTEYSVNTSSLFDNTTDFLNKTLLDSEEKEEDKLESKVNEETKKTNDDNETKQANDENDISQAHQEISEAEEGDEEESKGTFNSLALTLNFLQKKNIISKSTRKERESEEARQKAAKKSEILKLNIEVEERLLREEMKNDKKFMNKPKKEREIEFERILDRKLKEKGIIEDDKVLQEYNPKVDLKYRDGEGNQLTTKQAFKYLSHEFHGNGSGHKKKEKQIEKRKISKKSDVL